MKKLLWSIAKKLGIKHVLLILFGSDSYLCRSGWKRSMKTRLSVDRDGKPIPWYPYCATFFLEPRLNKDMDVFEYGCGYSTLWYSQRVKSVDCVESFEGWINKIKTMAGDNVSIGFSEEADPYIKMIDKFEKQYDIVVIDGYYRLECAKHCLSKLKPGGVIVFDNTEAAVDETCKHQQMYRDAIKTIMDAGYKRLQFMGLGAKTERAWETSIFYKYGNVLGI